MLKVSLQVFLTTDELHWDESTRPKSDSDLNSDSDSNCAACGKVESIAIIMWACWLPNKAMAKASLHQTRNAARVVYGGHILLHVPCTVSHSAHPTSMETCIAGECGCTTIADNRAWSAAAFLQHHPRGTCHCHSIQAALHLIKLQRSTVRHADMDVDVYVPHSAWKSPHHNRIMRQVGAEKRITMAKGECKRKKKENAGRKEKHY